MCVAIVCCCLVFGVCSFVRLLVCLVFGVSHLRVDCFCVYMLCLSCCLLRVVCGLLVCSVLWFVDARCCLLCVAKCGGCCALFVVWCLLPVVCYSFSVVWYVLFVVCWFLFDAC